MGPLRGTLHSCDRLASSRYVPIFPLNNANSDASQLQLKSEPIFDHQYCPRVLAGSRYSYEYNLRHPYPASTPERNPSLPDSFLPARVASTANMGKQLFAQCSLVFVASPELTPQRISEVGLVLERVRSMSKSRF